jgi:homogentisate 1,2-dioxygenase
MPGRVAGCSGSRGAGPGPSVARGHIRPPGQTTTTESAVMIDTFHPLLLGPAATGCEDPEYAWSAARSS